MSNLDNHYSRPVGDAQHNCICKESCVYVLYFRISFITHNDVKNIFLDLDPENLFKI